MNINQIDNQLIRGCKRVAVPFARVSLFVIFVWFGTLKILGVSPASELVQQLFLGTIGYWIPAFSFESFMILFGAFEVLIGILFVIPKAERVAFILYCIHFITTTAPLLILPALIWTGFLVPTLEGQYIIKNLALLACALSVMANTAPFSRRYLDVGTISSFR
jgi:uncharacterized membrane protein YkgB